MFWAQGTNPHASLTLIFGIKRGRYLRPSLLLERGPEPFGRGGEEEKCLSDFLESNSGDSEDPEFTDRDTTEFVITAIKYEFAYFLEILPLCLPFWPSCFSSFLEI